MRSPLLVEIGGQLAPTEKDRRKKEDDGSTSHLCPFNNGSFLNGAKGISVSVGTRSHENFKISETDPTFTSKQKTL